MKPNFKHNKVLIFLVALLLLIGGLGMMVAPKTAVAQANNVTLTVLDSNSVPMDGINVYYNDYGNHWVSLGTTTGGSPVTASFADGTYNFKAVKNYSEQIVTVIVSGTGDATFQTAKYTVNVDDVTGADFEGIAAAYNDYGNHYLSMGNTDANGNASIELFPGTYTFKAAKNYSEATGSLENNAAGSEETITFQTAKFTVHVTDSDGNDFEGIAAAYNDYGNHYLSMGNTDANGNASIELFPGTYTFKASKNYTEDTGDLTNDTSGTNATIDFQTAEAIAFVKDCDGTPLADFKVSFNDYGNHWLDMGTTGLDGKASIELFPGTRTIRAWKDYTYEVKDLSLTLTESTVEFNPTKVNWQYSGTIKYNDYGNHWKTMTSPFYLFPGTYAFRFDDYQTDVTISGCSMQQAINILKLTDHNGNPLAGGTARGGFGSSYSSWHVVGSTDANGILVDFHNVSSAPTTMSYEMKFNNTVAHKTQDVSANSTFEFQTNLLALRLETAGGTPLNGGNPRYGFGSTFTSWWFPGGVTGSSAPGETAAEFFPGTYSFEMQYQGTSAAKISVVIPDADTTLTWQTTNVTLQYSGQISYGGGSGDSRWFAKPSMELLQGSYKFHFRECDRTDITIPDPPSLTKSFVCAQLIDSGNNGLAGGAFDYRFGWGSYTAMGTTNSSGNLLYGIDGLQTSTKFRVSYAGGTTGDKSQNIAADSFVVFQTVPVTAVLNDSNASQITDGVTFEYRYGWGSKMPFDGAEELLPINTKVTVHYMGASIEKQQNASNTPDFVFTTVPVTAVLKDSTTSQITDGVTFEYRYGWGSKQPFSGPKELLPVNTKITVYYMGTSIEKEQNVSTSPDFEFTTVPVTAVLNDSNGATLGGATFEYRYGWGSKQPFSGPKELLPVNTKITVHYMGASIEKEQNANSNPTFVFNTVSVTSQLLASDGTTDLSGGATFEYRYGWGAYQPFTGPMELLPVNTKMRVSYAGGTTGDIEQNVGSNGHFSWQTGNVTSTSGNATDYRYGWGAYHPFTEGMELLPLATKFKFNDGTSETSYTIVSGATTTIH